MAYQSLYRKYRPQTFSDVVGQGHVTRTLQNAIASGRIAHGYLFTGTRGTAKTTVARLLAKALNCESSDRPVPEPCNVCAACVSITTGGNIDVIEMDAASHRGVADIEEVRKAVGYGPMELRYKVFIIDEAHQLSGDAKDAFLKTLEEPPANVVFILATTEPQSIPITIRSRCQQFDFKRGSISDIAGRLGYVLTQEGVSFTPDAVNMVARGAEGSYRDSLSLLEQVLAFSPERLTAADVHAVLGTLDSEALLQITDAVSRRDASTLFALAGEMLDAGKEARTILRALTAHFRDLLLVTVGGPAVSAELTADEVPPLQAQARAFTPTQILAAMDVLNEAQAETRWNNQQRFLIERTFLKLLGAGVGGRGSGDNAPELQFTPAPIVFASAPVPVIPPVVFAKAQSPNHPITQYPPSPTPDPRPPTPSPKSVVAEEPEMPASYFADDTETDEDGGVDESDLMGGDDTEDVEDTQPAPAPTAPEAEPVRDAPSNSLDFDGNPAEEPFVDDGPGLFDDADAPDAEDDISGDGGTPPAPEPVLPPAPVTYTEPEPSPVAEEAPVRVAPPLPTPNTQHPTPASVPNLFDLDMVIRIWPYFMADAARISKKTQMMMSQALPTHAEGATLEITFNNRPAYDMMSEAKGLEFVRQLLIRRMNVEKLTLRFVLSESVAPAPTRQEKKKVVKDRFADLDRLDAPTDDLGGNAFASNGNAANGNGYHANGFGGNGHNGIGIPPPARESIAAAKPQFAVSSARPSYAPVAAEPGFGRDAAPAMRHNSNYSNGLSSNVNSPETDDAPETPSHPLLEDVLTIFGGTVVKD